MKAPMLERSATLLGGAAMTKLSAARVLVAGVGGVGSWCAEALVRTGLGHITIVDDDIVAESNINRQSEAREASIGKAKVEAMAERLRSFGTGAEITAKRERITGFDAAAGEYDAVVDAIDSVDCKAALILGASKAGVAIVSSMGAAKRRDPTRVRVTRFEKVEGDGLARALRQQFKRTGIWPARKFFAVWSDELPSAGIEKGSVMQVTATFGMCLAATAIDLITGEREK